MVLLSSIALTAACGNGAPDVSPDDPFSSDTEINLVISDPATAPEELAMVIDFVSYRITCPESGRTPYDDSIDLAGNFEAKVDATPGVWQLVTDLPLSECTITLWVFYDDEVVCSGSQSMTVVDDGDPSAPGKVNITLQCSLSVIPPSGDLDVDGDFELVHGNYCPQLYWLGAVPTATAGVFDIETFSRDIDNTCGQNCDPQTCDFTANPPTCTPGPDLGLVSTLSAPAGNGVIADPNASTTTYTCDLLLPGPTEICVLVSDGDVDCDQMRCVTIECPDLCAGVDCDDGNECTRDRCDPLTGLCSNDPAPDGIACNDCAATCVGGTCSGPDWVGDVSGTFMTFQATLQSVDTTVVNAYSGQTLPVSGFLYVNTSSYEGVSANDTLVGTSFGDFFLAQFPIASQRICGVENIRTDSNFDSMILSDEFIQLNDMRIEGGDFLPDIIWANVGNDTLIGRGDIDFLDGGPGDDVIDGGPGDDIITLWPGSGFDSISGGPDTDRVEIDAIQSQIRIAPSSDPGYELDIFYLGTPMAKIREVELIVMNDAIVDVAACTGGVTDVCNLCGNDALNGGEECDDGNDAAGDGCAADCTAEY